MRFALVDSGLGVLPAAMHLRRLCPGAELVLSMDPDGMPWDAGTPDVAERALDCAKATLSWAPDVLVLACNTAPACTLDVLRAEFEPTLPVVGTVPAIKTAAISGGPIAVWATSAADENPYQQELIRRFAALAQVTEVACAGLVHAIETADADATAAAISAAAALTPDDTRAVVLGCTQYELAMDRIRGLLPRVRLHGSAAAVAAQAMRRIVSRSASAPDAASTSSSAGAPGLGVAASPGGSARPGTPGASGPPGATSPGPPGEAGQLRGRSAQPGRVRQPGRAGVPGSSQLAIAGTPGTDTQSGCGSAPPFRKPSGGGSGTDPFVAAGPAKPADKAAGDGEPLAPAVHVLLSGTPGQLPAAALHYTEGRLLADVTPGR